MVIKWNEINSVNVKEIDEQHQQLVAIMNKFFASNTDNKDDLRLTVKDLIEYANYHLDVEEKYFDEFKYEKAAEHKGLHDAYRLKVAEFQKQIEAEDYKIVFTTMSEFLREWWIFHINNIDIEYSECFNKHGLY